MYPSAVSIPGESCGECWAAGAHASFTNSGSLRFLEFPQPHVTLLPAFLLRFGLKLDRPGIGKGPS